MESTNQNQEKVDLNILSLKKIIVWLEWKQRTRNFRQLLRSLTSLKSWNHMERSWKPTWMDSRKLNVSKINQRRFKANGSRSKSPFVFKYIVFILRMWRLHFINMNFHLIKRENLNTVILTVVIVSDFIQNFLNLDSRSHVLLIR